MLRPRYPLQFLIALLIAASLWYALARGRLEQVTEKLLIAPIVLLDVPEELILTTPPPAKADVIIRGPLDMIRNLEAAGGLEVLVSLIDIEPGAATRSIDEASLRLPDGIRLISVEPPSFEVEVDSRAIRQVRIEAEITGSPAEGFELRGLRSRPNLVTVTGPTGVVDTLESIGSTSIDIDGAATPLQAQVQLRSPGPRTLLSPSTAMVFVDIGPIPVETEEDAEEDAEVNQ